MASDHFVTLTRLFKVVHSLPSMFAGSVKMDDSLSLIYLTSSNERGKCGIPIVVNEGQDQIRQSGKEIISTFLENYSRSYSTASDQVVSFQEVKAFLENQCLRKLFAVVGSGIAKDLLAYYSWFQVLDGKLVQRMGTIVNLYSADEWSSRNIRMRQVLARIAPLAKSKIKRSLKKKVISPYSATVARQRFLYFRSNLQLKFNHPVETKPTQQLIFSMFPLKTVKVLNNNPILQQSLAQLKKNLKRLHYKTLIEKTCPTTTIKVNDLPTVLKSSSSHDSVVTFLKHVLFKAFPANLFGPNSTGRKVFLRNLKEIIISGCNVKLVYKNFIRGIRIQDIPWLHGMNPDNCKEAFEDFIKYVVDFFIGLVKHYFYVTLKRGSKSKLIFYRQYLWNQIEQLTLSKGAFHLAPLTSSLPIDPIRVSKIRLIPKKKNCRILCTPLKLNDPQMQSSKAKRMMEERMLIAVLKFLKNTDGRHAVVRFAEAIRYLKEQNDKMYFIKGDIKDCYPSVKHDLMMQILRDRFKRMLGNFDEVCVQHIRISLQKKDYVQERDLYNVVPPANSNSMKFILNSSNYHAIKYCQKSYLKDPLEKIRVSFQEEFLKKGKTFFQMKEGLRQGGRLSPTLCALYMQDYLENQFPEVFTGKTGDSVLNEADDFVLLTNSLERGTELLNRLMKPSSKHNLHVNWDKLRTNIPVLNLPTEYFSKDLTYFGYRYNMSSARFSYDYSPYAAQDIRYTFNCNPFLGVRRTWQLLSSESFHFSSSF